MTVRIIVTVEATQAAYSGPTFSNELLRDGALRAVEDALQNGLDSQFNSTVNVRVVRVRGED